jgi:hypothetical protein
MSPQNPMPRVDFAQLFRSAEGLTQWRPMLLGFVTLLVSCLLIGGGQYAAMGASNGLVVACGVLVSILALIMLAAGFAGVGVLLMDRAKCIAPRSMIDALIFGLMCLPKFIGFALFLFVVVLLLALFTMLVYLVCKLPGVGPVLLFVAHPVLVIVSGVIFAMIFWVGLPLFAPAVLDGRSFKESISVVYTVAKTRLIQVVALFLCLAAVVFIIGTVVFAALVPGFGFTSLLATSVLGVASDGGGLSALANFASSGAGNGHASALMFGSALVGCLALTLMCQVWIMGINLVYLSCTDGLDFASGQAWIDAGLAQARQKAQEATERARLAAERARQVAPINPHEAVAATGHPIAPAPGAACPQCAQPVDAADLFCGGCGYKLK